MSSQAAPLIRRTSPLLPLLAALLISGALVIASGCIGAYPSNLAATQPSTVIDLATTQPSYWLDQPAVAEVYTTDFEAAIEAAKAVIRDYLFEIDRVDYRAGLVTSRPLASKQIFEFWRPDTGTASMAIDNTMNTIRRTIYIQIQRGVDSRFTLQPRILVERISLQERRLTDVAQYRQIFSGPTGSHANASRGQVARNADTETDMTFVPVRYWYPISRDPKMEIGVADRLREQLARLMQSGGHVAVAAPAGVTPSNDTPSIPFQSDGRVTAIGPNDTIYIDLGAADKVMPGMTFEIYDLRAVLPTLERYARTNPGAKAWVEVTTVGNASSTCRILSTTPGATRPGAGDPIHNFVFARNAQNHFALLGDFPAASRETLNGLIWRWNGIVDPLPTERTTYIIQGAAPKVGKELDAYTAALARARELKIPSISEDQFNLLIRYYDPAKR